MNYKLKDILEVYKTTDRSNLHERLKIMDPLWYRGKTYYSEATSISKSYQKTINMMFWLFLFWSGMGLIYGLNILFVACLCTFGILFVISYIKFNKYNDLSQKLWGEELHFFSEKNARV